MWMSDAFAEMMLGHLVCLVQGNAFILVEWAYLGRGKLRWPVLWAELLCMGQLGLSLATGMSFFNVQSVLLNVLYLFVTAQLFGGTFADKLTACLINGTMCLLVENTFQGLVLSQALLSLQLPITIFTQIRLTASKRVMGRYANSRLTNALLLATGIAVTAINVISLAG